MYFKGNAAAQFGGAIFLMTTSYVITKNSFLNEFVTNSASISGAMWTYNSQILSLEQQSKVVLVLFITVEVELVLR